MVGFPDKWHVSPDSHFSLTKAKFCILQIAGMAAVTPLGMFLAHQVYLAPAKYPGLFSAVLDL